MSTTTERTPTRHAGQPGGKLKAGDRFEEEGTGKLFEVRGRHWPDVGEAYLITGTTTGTCQDEEHRRALRTQIIVREVEDTAIEIRQGEQALELVAADITRLADAADKLLASGLNRRGLIVLLQDLTGLRKNDLDTVLRALPLLRKYTTEGE